MIESQGQRRALLVGVGRYDHPHQLSALPATRNDVTDLARVLRDPRRGHFSEVRELCDPDSQKLDEGADRLFSGAGPEDLVLFYFSGHGKLSTTRGALHLCATNTDEAALKSTSLPLSDINEYASSRTIAQVVIILDCCFSGAADLGFKSDLTSLVTSSLGQGQGKYVITSSSAIQVSRARPGDTHSLFTKWLIQGLETGAPDADDDQTITIEELFRWVRDRMAHDEPNQVPQSYTWSIKPGDVAICHSTKKRASGGRSTLASTNPDFFKAIEPLFPQRRVIPFLGSGIYGSGPLSPFRVSTALAEKGGLAGQVDLATSAEYLEWFFEERELFLRVFHDVLKAQSAGIEGNATHQLVAMMPPPPLVISATYDLLLEKQLDAEGIPFTLVTHILHSGNGRHDGKLLVIRRGSEASVKICPSDQLMLPSPPELTIYKVLGSPFLSEYAGTDADLDTVVVTEGDHLTFLSRLENEHTRVPDAFSIPFQQCRLLFLGYSLDIWHYRLVLRVFGQNKERMRKSYAVRQPASQMETLLWQRLGSNMIKTEPEQFAEQFVMPETPALAAR